MLNLTKKNSMKRLTLFLSLAICFVIGSASISGAANADIGKKHAKMFEISKSDISNICAFEVNYASETVQHANHLVLPIKVAAKSNDVMNLVDSKGALEVATFQIPWVASAVNYTSYLKSGNSKHYNPGIDPVKQCLS